MERLAEIRLTKSILLIPERVIWKYLPPSELEAGIKRGKAKKRCDRVERFEQSKIYPTYNDLFKKENENNEI
jgi:hypothetical protein